VLQFFFYLFIAKEFIGCSANQGDQKVLYCLILAVKIITCFDAVDCTNGNFAFFCQGSIRQFKAFLPFVAPLDEFGEGQEHQIWNAAFA
jgi:hypothetical protein